MVENFSNGEAKVLKWIVSVLILILTGTTAWNALSIANLPDKYVRLERYQCDQKDIKDALNKMDDKLDELIAIVK